MSSGEFDDTTLRRLRELAKADGAAAHRNGVRERLRRTIHHPLGRVAIYSGVALIAGAAIVVPRIGSLGSAHEAVQRHAATAESQSMRNAISGAIDPTMSTIAKLALTVHEAHPGSEYRLQPDGHGGGTVVISDWSSNKAGAVTSIDVVMGLKGNKADTSHVLFADIEAPATDLAAANAGFSDEAWFVEAGGKNYIDGLSQEASADLQDEPWNAPAALAQSYQGINHSVTIDTTSQMGLATGDNEGTLTPAATANEIAQAYTPLILEKISGTLG